MKTTKAKYCRHCVRFVAAMPASKPSHLLHFAFTLASCGLYFPFWLLHTFNAWTAGWRCPVCGKRA